MIEAASATNLLSSGIIHIWAFYRERLQSHALCVQHTVVYMSWQGVVGGGGGEGLASEAWIFQAVTQNTSKTTTC